MKTPDKVPMFTLDDAADAYEAAFEKRGMARFEKLTLELVVKLKNSEYEIDLEEANNAEQMLDWILQVGGKRTNVTLSDFCHALDQATREVFNDSAQGVMCPMAIGSQSPPRPRHWNWKTGVITGDKKKKAR